MTFVSSLVPRNRASCKVVEAKISFKITTLAGVADRRISPILTRSSSSFPLIVARSSSRPKWVNRRSGRNRRAALPGTGQPMAARWWSWPKVRANVVLPPWLGPVTTKIRSRPSSRKSFVTTGLRCEASLLARARSKVSSA